ncbi:MAG: SCO family protein, partial [Bdellovibrionaceae bacterium]|nr:SCO family protein [Pseudobdellovibrionaceae bacterium]
NDKPDEVAEYAAQFFPEFLGLSGSREEIDKTVFLFHASYIVEKDPKSYLGYSIAHTDRLFFLDQKGQVVAMLASPKSADDILKLIKENL